MIRRLLRSSYQLTGGHALSRHRSRHSLRILMYHRFAGRERHLAAQCEHIRRHYNPVSMDQVADWLAGNAPLPERALAVTVDDGYRDFLEIAWPLFARYEIPTMVYVVSGFAAGECWLWWDLLTEHLLQSAARRIRLPELAGQPAWEPAGAPPERRQAAERLAYALMKVSDNVRRAYIDALPAATGVQLPATPPPAYAAMNWQEIRHLAQTGAHFGAHTRTHPILSRLDSSAEQQNEMMASRDALASALGLPVRHFCYPVGGPEEFNDASVVAARNAGFATATTTIRGLNHQSADPFRLNRLGVEPDQDPLYFAELLAGVRSI